MKKILILSLLVIMIFGISCVNATDNLTDDVGCNDNDVNLSCSFDDSIVKSTDIVLEKENIDEFNNSFDNDILMASGKVSTNFVVPERFQDSFKILIVADSGSKVYDSFKYTFDSETYKRSARGGDTIWIPSNLKTDSFHTINLYYDGSNYYEHCYQTFKFYYVSDGYSEFTYYWPKDTHFSISSKAYGGINVILSSDYDELSSIKFEYYLDNDTTKHYARNGVIPLNYGPNTTHNITCVFSGNEEYKPCSKSVKFTYRSSIKILESTQYVTDGGMRMRYQILKFDGSVIGNEYVFLPFGTHNIEFFNTFNGEKIVKEYTIPKRILQSEDLIVNYSDLIEYKVRAANENDIFTSDLTVTFYINEEKYEVKTDDSGFATLKIPLKAGNYSITTKYWGVVNENNITVNPIYLDNYYKNMYLHSATAYVGENKIIYYGLDGYFKGSFRLYQGSKLIKTLDLDTSGYVNDYSQNIFYSDNITTADFGVGYYTLKILDKKGNVLKESYMDIQKSPTQIQVNTIKTIANSKYTLKIKVKDKIGNNVKNGYVNVKIAGKTYKVKVSGGVATLKITAPSKIKTYSCSVNFLENSIYKASSAKFNMIVKKYTSKTTTKSVSLTQGSSYTLNVNVKYSSGKKITSGTVKVKINGKTYAAKINKGIAKVNIKAPITVGTYSCQATYLGSKLIHSSSCNFKIVVKAKPKHIDIEVPIAEGQTFTRYSGDYKVVSSLKITYTSSTYLANISITPYKNNNLIHGSYTEFWVHEKTKGWIYLGYRTHGDNNVDVPKYNIFNVDKAKVRIHI